jgi:bacterioferritin (cytochrome b1)
VDEQAKALNQLLRCELTAVNQQFTHVLALREWGESEVAARIMEVDMVDFPNAMRILDSLVETGQPLDLVPDSFVPGSDVRGILLAEQTMEQRLTAAIDEARVIDQRAQALVATAQEPRQAYAQWLAEWLADRLSEGEADGAAGPRNDADTADLVAHLITMVEQTLVHAFVHRHAGDVEGADAAWAASGGAMMRLTKMVRLFAAQRRVPAPGAFPAMHIAIRPEEAVEADRALAMLVAEEAARLAGQRDSDAVAGLCRRIADYSLEQSRWSPGQEHPASRTNPPAFASFETTLKRFDIAA